MRGWGIYALPCHQNMICILVFIKQQHFGASFSELLQAPLTLYLSCRWKTGHLSSVMSFRIQPAAGIVFCHTALSPDSKNHRAPECPEQEQDPAGCMWA